MKLGALLKASCGRTYRNTSSFLSALGEISEPVPVDMTEIQSKGSFSKMAYCLLDDREYYSMKRKLFDKIIQCERHDEYAYYNSYNTEDKDLCESALIYTADMLDHGKVMYEIVDALGLHPMTVTAICKLFNDIKESANDEDEE